MPVARTMLVVAAAVIAQGVSSANAAYLEYGGATIAAGEAGQISVVLRTEGDEIAGVLNEIALPPALHLIADGGACYANPAIGKEATAFCMLWHTTGSERLRAVVISLQDVAPIPDGSVLYTCDIEVAADVPAGVYRVRAENLQASDSVGTAVPLRGVDGTVTVAATAARAGAPSDAAGATDARQHTPAVPRTHVSPPTPIPERARRAPSTPVPTPTPTPDGTALASQAALDQSSQGAAGCQIASDSHQSCWLSILAVATLGLLRGRRRRHFPVG